MEETIAAAAAALDTPVELVANLSFSERAIVLRLATRAGSVIAKRHHDDEARTAEVTALRNLPADVRPELLARNDKVIAMSDLGDGPSVAELLLGNDPDAAERALLAWARAVGRVAAHSAGRAPPGAVRIVEPDLDALRVLTGSLGVEIGAALVRELAEAHDLLAADPGRHAYIVGDACPDNNRVGPDQVRLFDFEFSRWSHTGVDASYVLVPFCSCWCLARFPPGLQQLAYEAYADEYPAANADRYLGSVIRAGSLFLVALLPLWLDRLGDDLPMGPAHRAPADARQALAHRLRWLGHNERLMPATAAFAHDLRNAVSARFPSSPLPLFPAFQTGSETA